MRPEGQPLGVRYLTRGTYRSVRSETRVLELSTMRLLYLRVYGTYKKLPNPVKMLRFK